MTPRKKSNILIDDIQKPTDRRLFALYQFFQEGGTVEEAQELSQIDPWFLHHLQDLAHFRKELREEKLTPALLRQSERAWIFRSTRSRSIKKEDGRRDPQTATEA